MSLKSVKRPEFCWLVMRTRGPVTSVFWTLPALSDDLIKFRRIWTTQTTQFPCCFFGLSLKGPEGALPRLQEEPGFPLVVCNLLSPPSRPSQLWASSSRLPSRRPVFLLVCWAETCVPVLLLGQVMLIYCDQFIILGPFYKCWTRWINERIPLLREDSSLHVAGVGAFGL